MLISKSLALLYYPGIKMNYEIFQSERPLRGIVMTTMNSPIGLYGKV